MGTSTSDELRALTRLAVDELREATGGIGAVHRAIADRAWVGGGVPKALHDAIAATAYGAVRGGAALAGRAADAALSRREARALSATPRGAAALAVVNGLRGDVLEREGSPLALPMTLHGGDGATRLAVFVHGLFETEQAWRYGGGPTYGERLEADCGLAPAYVRYNTGRRVADNGRSLADLLVRWPHPLEQVVLVGHSMGGLVARRACHVASERGDAWVKRVTHVVALGAPHTGAPLESAVHHAAAALGVAPETQPFGRGLRRRSAGIRDMRHGTRELPLLDGATHCYVAATVTTSPRHPVARAVGDWLVLQPSASHRAQQALHVGPAHHLALLNHPDVYERLRKWLAPAPRAA
jgi:pimeloyl-ACP methyl ester carboxylesterase